MVRLFVITETRDIPPPPSKRCVSCHIIATFCKAQLQMGLLKSCGFSCGPRFIHFGTLTR